MVKDIRSVAQIRGQVCYERTDAEKASMVFRRSVFAVKDIPKGEAFTKENIRIIRPGYGARPKEYNGLIGQLANQNYTAGDPISSMEKKHV